MSTTAIERAAQAWSDGELARHVNRSGHSGAITGPDEDGFFTMKLPLCFTFVEVVFTAGDGQVFIHGANVHGGWVGNDHFAPHVLHKWTLAIEKELA